MHIPVISPAFRWAQSLSTVYLEVQFSTRLGSPACLDLSEYNYSISEDGETVSVSAMCTNDKKLLKYELNLKLNDPVMPIEVDKTSPEAISRKAHIEKTGQTAEQVEEHKLFDYQEAAKAKEIKKLTKEFLDKKEKEENEAPKKWWTKKEDKVKTMIPKIASSEAEFPRKNSEFIMQSVGRLHVTLPKKGKLTKWTMLCGKGVQKPKNSSFWWDMHTKYENELKSD